MLGEHMKAYVRTLELIIAVTLLSSLIIYVYSSYLQYRTMGTQTTSTLNQPVISALNYLEASGYLTYVSEHGYWDELDNTLENILVVHGIGYKLKIYALNISGESGLDMILIAEYEHSYSVKSLSRDTVYYYIPPRIEEPSISYLIIMHLSR